MLCSRCHIDQPRDQFGPSADMWPRHRQCRKCSRRIAMIRKHGIDSAQKTEIAEHQGGCAICGHDDPGSRGWVVDHDRTCCPTEKSCPKCRRGVLCQYCNWLLGNAFDRVETLTAAISYLQKPRDCSWHVPVACAPSICGSHASRNATDRTDKDVLTEKESFFDESFN